MARLLTRLAPKRALAIFAAAFLIVTCELCWWVTFNVRQTHERLATSAAQLAAQCELAHTVQQRLGGAPNTLPPPWLMAAFPQLMWQSNLGRMVARPEVLGALEARHHAHVRMFLAEGTFFFFMVVLGAALIVRTMRFELGVVRQQGNFLNAVTHELKSPLASMRLYIETLERRRVDPATLSRYVATLGSECDRLETLVNHVLTLARLEGQRASEGRGSQPLPTHTMVDVASCVAARVAQMLRHRPAFSGALTFRALQRPLWARAEAATVETVVRNLVDNAMKYGGTAPRIDVRCGQNLQWVWVTVQDFGLGLTAAQLRRVFDRFYRVGDEMVRRREGSGLGLYLTRMLVEEHGGVITAHSDGLGHGATFIASFPRVSAPEPSP